MSRTRSTASTRCRDFDPVEDSIDLSGLGGAILVSSYQPGLASMMQATLTHDLGRNTTTISIFNGSAGAAFEIDVADHLSALTGISGIFAPLLVTFEDLGPYDGADTPVPNGYYGFD